MTHGFFDFVTRQMSHRPLRGGCWHQPKKDGKRTQSFGRRKARNGLEAVSIEIQNAP
ncbi:MAG: hypothetical protein NTAFB01_03710 [Nitrospira sp.]